MSSHAAERMESNEKGRYLESYIGDGAYIYMDACRNVVLYTSDGYSETNRVVIDMCDVPTLMRWIARRRAALCEHDDADDLERTPNE